MCHSVLESPFHADFKSIFVFIQRCVVGAQFGIENQALGASEARVQRFSFDCCATTTLDQIMALGVPNRELNSVFGTLKIIVIRFAVQKIFELAWVSCLAIFTKSRPKGDEPRSWISGMRHRFSLALSVPST
jgi:hypothetical protein